MTRWAVLILAALVAGCAQMRERVVLLPDAEGHTGAVVVKTKSTETELATPYAAVEVKDGRVVHSTLVAQDVHRRYAPVLAAQPPKPRAYVVYFYFEKTELTPESMPVLEKIKAELAANPAAEVVVIGHTDRVGTEEFNDRLAVKRAESVRNAFLSIGVPVTAISIEGRGEREPAVATADEVPEPRNRRVEIKIR